MQSSRGKDSERQLGCCPESCLRHVEKNAFAVVRMKCCGVTCCESSFVNCQSVLQVAIAVGAVIGVIVYRMAVLAALYLREEEILYKNASLVTTATAACINLAIIFIMNYVSSAYSYEKSFVGNGIKDRNDFSILLIQLLPSFSSIIWSSLT